MENFSNIEDNQRLAKMLSTSRYKMGKSQEFMALGLNVSKNTIYNFEKGTSKPTLDQFKNWFILLGLNPTPYILQYCNPVEMEDISAQDSDTRISEALHKLIDTLDITQQRYLMYIMYGSHGSDPKSVLQMIVANLHTPMRNRVAVCGNIIDNFDIADSRDELVEKDHIMPDMDNLRASYEAGKMAAIKGNSGYVNN